MPLAGQPAGWLANWLAGWPAGWLAGCLAGWQAGWLAGSVSRAPLAPWPGQHCQVVQHLTARLSYAVRAAAALLALLQCITAARPWSVFLFQLWVVMHLAEVAQIAVGVQARHATAVAFILH